MLQRVVPLYKLLLFTFNHKLVMWSLSGMLRAPPGSTATMDGKY
jgi:hypothetical protein